MGPGQECPTNGCHRQPHLQHGPCQCRIVQRLVAQIHRQAQEVLLRRLRSGSGREQEDAAWAGGATCGHPPQMDRCSSWCCTLPSEYRTHCLLACLPACPPATHLHRARQADAEVSHRMLHALQLHRAAGLEQRQAVQEGLHVGARLQHLPGSPAGSAGAARRYAGGSGIGATVGWGRAMLANQASAVVSCAAGPTWTAGTAGRARR